MARRRATWLRIRTLLLPLLLLCPLGAGCISVPAPRPVDAPQLKPGSTYLLHLSGISGITIFDTWWLRALQDAGAADRVDTYDWAGPGGWVQVLHAVEHNRKAALKVAEFVTEVRRRNPDVRIIMSSESGGTAVAAWTLEALPDDVKVDEVLLIAPAVSPGYDLSRALAHVTGAVRYTTTPLDFGTLGLWTSVLGNMDGPKGAGAGLVGFREPPGADPHAYRRLLRISYNPAWIIWGNLGSHTGAMSSAFARHVLGPMLVEDRKRATKQPVAPATTRASGE